MKTLIILAIVAVVIYAALVKAPAPVDTGDGSSGSGIYDGPTVTNNPTMPYSDAGNPPAAPNPVTPFPTYSDMYPPPSTVVTTGGTFQLPPKYVDGPTGPIIDWSADA